MGSYQFEKPKQQEENASGKRSIGCLLMVILPVIAYPGAFFLLEEVPPVRSAAASMMSKLFVQIPIPSNLYRITAMADVWAWIEAQNSLLVSLILGSVILLLLYTFISLLFAMMYRTVNPKRYGPTDAPPKRRKIKKFKR